MKRCTICKKEILEDRYAPFCSARCKNIDLAKWFNGNYFIPGDDFEKKSEKSVSLSRQDSEIDLYDSHRSPDSSVGRAED